MHTEFRTCAATVLILAAVFTLGGCSSSGSSLLARIPGPRDLPFIYKIDVQQGNVINQDMIAQLRRGMDRKKVKFIMGTPIIHDTFNANRWDYLYTFHEGGGKTERRQITLYFKDDKLDRVSGDVKAADASLVVNLHNDTTVDVPTLQQKSLLTRLTSSLPFTKDKSGEAGKNTANKNEKDKNSATTKTTADKTADGAKTVAGAAAPEAVAAGTETVADSAAAAPLDAAVDKKSAAAKSVTTVAEELKEDPEHQALGPLAAAAGVQIAPGEGVVVPPDAPFFQRHKGFFQRLADSLGIGAGDDEDRGPPPEPQHRRMPPNPND